MAAKKFAGAGSRESFWREHEARWVSSGRCILGYCKAQGLSEGCFHIAQRRYSCLSDN